MKNREEYKKESLSMEEMMLINGGSKEARQAGMYWGRKIGRLYVKYGPAVLIALVTRRIKL